MGFTLRKSSCLLIKNKCMHSITVPFINVYFISIIINKGWLRIGLCPQFSFVTYMYIVSSAIRKNSRRIEWNSHF